MDLDQLHHVPPLTVRRSLAVYLAVAAAVSLLFLGRADLIRMEPIIALGGRHMLETGQWFVPRLYGQVYAFKPALAYWFAAAAQGVAGQSELALRLPTAACGVLLGLLIQQVLARLASPRCGLYAALLAVTSLLYTEQARMVGFDMPLALGAGTAMLAACRNLAAGRSSWRRWLPGYFGLLFGFLAKGLPAVFLYVPGLVLAAIVLRRTRLLLHWAHLLGAGLFVLAATCYVYLAYREGGSLAISQQVDEIRSRSSDWTLRALAATLAKPAMIFAAFLPGSFFLLFVATRRQRAALPPPCSTLAAAAWTFLLAGLAVLLASPTSNTRYYLPLLTPIALLAGLGADRLRPAVAQSNQLESQARIRGTRRRFALFHQADPVFWAVLAGLVLWCAYIGGIEPVRATRKSLRSVATSLEPCLPAGETVFADVGDSYSSLFYYLGHRVVPRTIDAEPPSDPIYVLLVNEQIALLAKRRDLVLRTLADCRDLAGNRYVIAIAAPSM